MRSERTPRLRRALASTLVLGALGGCALVLGIEDKPPFGSTDAGFEAAPDPCGHVLPPGPGTDDDPDTLKSYVLALRTIDITKDDAGDSLGFDLDHKCSCGPGDGPFDGGPSCIPASVDGGMCDIDGGIDDALGSVDYLQLAGQGSASRHEDIKCGRNTILGVLVGYNGRANDSKVSFAVVLSPGLDQPHEDGEAPSSCNDSGPDYPIVYTPRWDGTDRWSSDTRFVDKKTTTPALLIPGYVTNYTLVAQAPGDQVLTMPYGPVMFNANQLTIVAQLEPLGPDGGSLPQDGTASASMVRVNNGQMAGRVTVRAVLQALSSIGIRDVGYLCPGNVTYEAVRSNLCQIRDLVANPQQDFTGVTCDSVSAAARFTAEPAIMTPAKDAGPDLPTPCPPAPDQVCP
jgi:hypothetical protein